MSKSETNQLVRQFIYDFENDRKPETLTEQLNKLFQNVKQIKITKLKKNPMPLVAQDDLKNRLKQVKL
jgi:acetolactate synthase regulatory subunit